MLLLGRPKKLHLAILQTPKTASNYFFQYKLQSIAAAVERRLFPRTTKGIASSMAGHPHRRPLYATKSRPRRLSESSNDLLLVNRAEIAVQSPELYDRRRPAEDSRSTNRYVLWRDKHSPRLAFDLPPSLTLTHPPLTLLLDLSTSPPRPRPTTTQPAVQPSLLPSCPLPALPSPPSPAARHEEVARARWQRSCRHAVRARSLSRTGRAGRAAAARPRNGSWPAACSSLCPPPPHQSQSSPSASLALCSLSSTKEQKHGGSFSSRKNASAMCSYAGGPQNQPDAPILYH
jgi:hypothetical protein